MPVLKFEEIRMPYVVKCSHCDFVAYREIGNPPKRCPKCGSPAEKVKSPYDTETITVSVMDTRAKVKNVTVTFHDLGSIVNNIIGISLNNDIPAEHLRQRVLYMVKVYLWILLKKAPQLWLHIDTAINGVKELLLLKLDKQGE
jgi:hypothetical protein